MKRVSIISTGSELVYGRVQDSNAAFISACLFPTAFTVVSHHAVGDVVEDLRRTINTALCEADIVIMSGGLGPTDDDRTMEVVGAHCGVKSTVNEPALRRVEFFFNSMGREMLPGDVKMVTVPAGSIVFENETGLAPGFAIDYRGKILVAMPGVPHELRPMFEKRVMPHLHLLYPGSGRDSLTLRVVLMREAEVNDQIKKMALPFDSIDWGITTSPGMNTVGFVSRAEDPLPKDLIIAEAKRTFGNKMLALSSKNIEEDMVRLLEASGISAATAESCTGGLIAQRITDVPGSSRVFKGGVVAYSNEAKRNLLDVSAEVLDTYGAVSEETALEMAHGALRRFAADMAVAVTGIAGPGGGTEAKPVGTVCFAIATVGTAKTFTRNITGDRERVRQFSSQYALDGIRRGILS
ncbi:MAG TPA: CinA family nicotinamide mononucleotide deamidase-related protein [Spirochaetota bacterium]|nr:CinA family nicotinamide mononucleotide deamidase-related protein [Spirochaetota bacterium]